MLVNHVGEPLSRDEVELLIAGITDKADRALLVLGFGSGIRKAEIEQVTHDTINYPNQVITVYDKWLNRQRSLYISKPVLELLHDYENITYSHDSRMIFRYSQDTIDNKVKKYCEEILSKNKSWLAVRRTYVNLCVEAEMPMSIVIENTGEKPEIIHRYFSNPDMNPIQEVNSRVLFSINQRRLV